MGSFGRSRHLCRRDGARRPALRYAGAAGAIPAVAALPCAAIAAVGALLFAIALINHDQPSAQLILTPEMIVMIGGATIATAALSVMLVTWRTVHVRPMEVLREG